MSDILRKALDQSTGGVLSPESLEPKLVERARELSPAWAMFNVARANGATHTFKARTALPTANFEAENTATAVSVSSYTSTPVGLKIIRNKGSVTGFTQSASAGFIDAYTSELDGGLIAVNNAIDFGVLWGNTNQPYMFGGIDQVVDSKNVFQGAGAVADLADLDNLVDAVIGNGYDREMNNLCLFVSPQLRSTLGRGEARLRFAPTSVKWAAGVEVDSYRGVPIKLSSRCAAQTAMGTVTAATATSGGALPDSTTFYYRVAYVNRFGESVACAEISQATGGSGGAHKNTLSWTAVSGALLYKIFIGTSAGGTKLAAVIDAKSYDAAGTPTGVITGYVHSAAITAGVQVPLETGHQVMFLANTDPDVFELAGLRDLNGNAVSNMITYLPLAIIGDSMDFMLKSYLASVPKIPNMMAVGRGFKLV